MWLWEKYYCGSVKITSAYPFPLSSQSTPPGTIDYSRPGGAAVRMEYDPIKSPDSSMDSSMEGMSHSWVEWTRQLHAYLAWVNSQLKKKPGTRLVEDLRHDMKDGVALINLVEIVGGEKLSGVHMCPSNLTEMKDNVEKVLQFMSLNRIKMHHIVAKDIVEGNLKSVMRLILALAAHFKPKSVRQSGFGVRSPGKSPNVASIAQGAVAALADARRDVARAGSTRYRRRAADKDRHDRRLYRESSSDQCSDSDQSFSACERLRPAPTGGDHHRDIEGVSVDSGSGSRGSPVTGGSPRKDQRTGVVSKSRSSDHVPASHIPVPVSRRGKGESVERGQYDELMKEHEELDKQMRETKKQLMMLQDLLLRGQLPDGEESPTKLPTEGSPSSEQVVILKSQLQQSTLFCEDIKEELSKSKNECLRLQGVKAGLQQRLTEQEKVLLQMKAELLRKGFDLQNVESERDEMQKLLHDKDKIIADLKTSLSTKDHRVDKLQNDLKYQLQEKESISKNLKSQVHDLHSRLKTVGETEASLSARVATQDKMMAKLEGKILKTQIEGGAGSNRSSALLTNADELQVVRDSLQSLRSGFLGADPHQHTIDTLEQSISTLIEKLHTAHSQSGSAVDGLSKRLNFDSKGEAHRSNLPGFPLSRLDESSMNGQGGTKVLYFTDRTVTPFMCTLPQKLGEITLGDIKRLHDRPGRYRYHFKAQDPEFGTVKEEVSFDEDVIPGWEGKIVAWIEEDTDEL
ncbi:dixin-like isoform X2 [Liolophura sinensis]|uniref:dixin-like isoform X2 n=1 Tax=Liolophura sinensis TaxID=3198878 RepID=UPI0031598482